MTESHGSSRNNTARKHTAAKAEKAAGKATAPAARAAKQAASATEDATSAAQAGTARVVGATNAAARTAARGVESGRQAIVTASGQVASTAKTAWTVFAQRKLIAAGVGAGLTALTATSYALGRRAQRQSYGPLTRLTQGRI
ncbi:hypothetical protein ABZ858_23880 [Streptomyces sp. NPDC047017]|uniref:hypothetical protein n=1 Tax=Streptomyces sp. NPDC047017 TaxID=3155024 RepID=UPI0033FA3813